MALELAHRGVHIIVNYFRNRGAAEITAAEIKTHGVEAIIVKAHVGKRDQIGTMFEAAKETFGGIDILICNAASGVFRPAMEVDQKAWDWTMSINAQSVLWCAQHAVAMMQARGSGRIVNVSSIFTTRTLPFYTTTGASKAVIDALTRYLAVELAPKGVIVNAVAPGVVFPTAPWNVYPSDTIVPQTLQRTPIGRLVTPEDVAKVVAFLCSSDAEAIVGQTIIIDGGFTITF
jgi:enoyl-[acyl-carrier protein] reductase III